MATKTAPKKATAPTKKTGEAPIKKPSPPAPARIPPRRRPATNTSEPAPAPAPEVKPAPPARPQPWTLGQVAFVLDNLEKIVKKLGKTTTEVSKEIEIEHFLVKGWVKGAFIPKVPALQKLEQYLTQLGY